MVIDILPVFKNNVSPKNYTIISYINFVATAPTINVTAPTINITALSVP